MMLGQLRGEMTVRGRLVALTAAVAAFMTLAALATVLLACLPLFWTLGLSWAVRGAGLAAVLLLIVSAIALFHLHELEFSLRRPLNRTTVTYPRVDTREPMRATTRKAGLGVGPRQLARAANRLLATRQTRRAA